MPAPLDELSKIVTAAERSRLEAEFDRPTGRLSVTITGYRHDKKPHWYVAVYEYAGGRRVWHPGNYVTNFRTAVKDVAQRFPGAVLRPGSVKVALTQGKTAAAEPVPLALRAWHQAFGLPVPTADEVAETLKAVRAAKKKSAGDAAAGLKAGSAGVKKFNKMPLRERAKIRLRGAALANLDLAGVKLGGVDLTDADPSGTKPTGAKLQEPATGFFARAARKGAKFVGADLSGANLQACRCAGADFSRADLTAAKARGVECQGARFAGANLTDADLNFTDLRGADFTGATLAGNTFTGAIRRDRHSPRKVFRNLDLKTTLRRNPHNYHEESGKLLVDKLFFYAAERKKKPWHVIVDVDRSGSMLDSAIFSAVMASIFAELPAVKTSLVLFDTQVVDLSDQVGQPVDVLLSIQLGGGTDITMALQYAAGLVRQPARAIVVLISDFYEGRDENDLVAQTRLMGDGGVRMIGFGALGYDARPAHNKETAKKLRKVGMDVLVCTPERLAECMAEITRG
jgi:uncharacterized protein YjbI with pentapeptide repeats